MFFYKGTFAFEDKINQQILQNKKETLDKGELCVLYSLIPDGRIFKSHNNIIKHHNNTIILCLFV